MSAPTSLNSPASMQHHSAQQSAPTTSDVQDLLRFAAAGLVAMFDKDKQLFCHRLLTTKQGLIREGMSPRYTVMTLLGLKELELAGGDLPLDIRSIYTSFVRDTKWIQGIGDMGLLIWLVAAFNPDHLNGFLHALNYETALDRFSDAREHHTMELAWFLSGLAHAAEACPKLVGALTEVAMKTYHRMAENRGQHGFFSHKGRKNSLSGRLRGHIGSFADQVYPIYAMSKFAKAFHLAEPLGTALTSATAICRAQGKSGQWWWLYNARNARVSSRYPVYSVHQHGMAPMCLFAVEDTTGQSFREPIYKGLRWIYGHNELSLDMRDANQTLIWRGIFSGNRWTKFWEIGMSAIRPTNHDAQVRSLEVLYEQRPYEFGWLLFAFSRHAQVGPQVQSV
jgi:hypothetical protein